MGLKLNTASSGSVTIEPANTANNYTLTVPAQDGTAIIANSDGNVGIGTSSPADKLEVAGSLGTVSVDSGGNYLKMSREGGNYIQFGSTNASLIFTRGATERGRFDSSGNFLFNSGYGSSAIAYGCRAWVNFNGTGTVAIRASGNVSSITDGGVGIYTINFSTAMPDTNYCVILSGVGYSTSDVTQNYVIRGSVTGGATTQTTSSLAIQSGSTVSGASNDAALINVAIFR